MTATPLRDETRDTYRYVGNPLYEYSLRQGIDGRFSAPYRVHRVITDWDAAGWRPNKDDLDRCGQASEAGRSAMREEISKPRGPKSRWRV